MRKFRAGFTMGPLLALAMVCLVLAFTVCSLSTFQLNASMKASTSDEALFLAEGAVAQTMSCVWNGLSASPVAPYGWNKETIVYQDPSYPGATGTVSFDPKTPWGYSTNNYDGKHGAGWNGESLATGMVQIVAQGTVGKSTRTIEALVSVPPYPYVLSVDGALDTKGTTLVAKAESSMASFETDEKNNTLNQSMPANIGSNTSIKLGPDSFVSGDVVCSDSAQVKFGAGSQVSGTVRQGVVTPPRTLKIASYDNSLEKNVATLTAASGDVTVINDTYAPGNLTVPGDLNVQNCTLYVNGNLKCDSLEGTGAVFVTGNVTVNGGANLSASNMLALAAAGNVDLIGPTNASKYFQGLVFTEGTLTASNLTIAGCFVSIANGADGGSGASGMTLQDVTVVYVGGTSTITGQDSSMPLVNSIEQGLRASYDTYVVATNTNTNYWLPSVLTQDSNIDIQTAAAVKTAMAGNPVYTKWLENGGVMSAAPPFQPVPAGSMPIGHIELPLTGGGGTMYVDFFNYGIVYDPATNQFIKNPSSPPNLINGWPSNPLTFSPTPPFMSGQSELWDAGSVDSWLKANGYNVTAEQIMDALSEAQTAYMNAVNPLLKKGGTLLDNVPNLTLNNFLSNSSPLHIVSWRER